MHEPLIFISHHHVPADQLDELCRLGRAFTEYAETVEPDAVTLQLFLDATERQLVYVQVQPTAEAMDAHLQLTHERITQALELVETTSITVCGTPGPLLTEALRHNRDAGVTVTVLPARLSGFLRPTVATAA